MRSSARCHPAAPRSAATSPATAASGTLAGVRPTADTRPVSRSRLTCRLYPSNSTDRDLRPCRLSGSSTLIAGPGPPAAQRQRRAGAVHVLVTDLAGDRHRRGGGLIARLAGDERFHLAQQAQYLGQGLIPGSWVIPVRVLRGLQAEGGQYGHPGLLRHHGGPCGLPHPAAPGSSASSRGLAGERSRRLQAPHQSRTAAGLCRTGRADRGGARGGNWPGCFPVARSRPVACVLAMMARFRRGG